MLSYSFDMFHSCMFFILNQKSYYMIRKAFHFFFIFVFKRRIINFVIIYDLISKTDSFKRETST